MSALLSWLNGFAEGHAQVDNVASIATSSVLFQAAEQIIFGESRQVSDFATVIQGMEGIIGEKATTSIDFDAVKNGVPSECLQFLCAFIYASVTGEHRAAAVSGIMALPAAVQASLKRSIELVSSAMTHQYHASPCTETIASTPVRPAYNPVTPQTTRNKAALSKVQSEFSDVKQQLEEAIDENEKLIEEVELKSKQVVQLQHQVMELSNKTAVMQQLQDEVESLRFQAKNAAKFEAELLVLREKVDMFSSESTELETLKNEHANRSNENSDLKSRLQIMEKQVSEFRQQSKQTDMAMMEMRTSLQHKEIDFVEISKKNQALQSELLTSTSRLESTSNTVVGLEHQIKLISEDAEIKVTSLQAQVQSYQTEVTELKQKLREAIGLEMAVTDLTNRYSDLQACKDQVEQTFLKTDLEAKSLQIELSNSKDMLQSRSTAISKLEQAMEHTKSQLQEQLVVSSTLERDNSRLNLALKNLREDFEYETRQWQQKLEASNHEVSLLIASRSSLESAHAAAVEQHTATIELIQGEVDAAKANSARLQNHIEALQKEASESVMTFKLKEEQFNCITDTLQQEHTAKCSDFEQKISKLQDELALEQTKAVDFEEKFLSLEKQLQSLQHEAQLARFEAKKSHTRAEQAEKDTRQVEQDYESAMHSSNATVSRLQEQNDTLRRQKCALDCRVKELEARTGTVEPKKSALESEILFKPIETQSVKNIAAEETNTTQLPPASKQYYGTRPPFADDEGFDTNTTSSFTWTMDANRVDEMKRRNNRQQPHLRDHYALELQETPSTDAPKIAPVKTLGTSSFTESLRRRKAEEDDTAQSAKLSKKAEAFEVDVGVPVKATRAHPMLNSTLRARNKEESAKSKEDAVATKPVRVPLKTSNKSAAK